MPDDYVARTVAAYDAHPEQYETSTNDLIVPQLDEFIKQLPRSEKLVLDVGCGFGKDTAILAAAGAHVVGIDMSEKLLERARVRFPDVEFRQMDMRKLDFADGSCKAIWCTATLLHLNEADMLVALREFNRVLMHGGLVVLSVKEGEGEVVVVDKFSSDGERYYNYETVETLRQKLQSACLTVQECYVVNERDQCGPTARDLNWVRALATKK